ncbi:peptidyl-prolyl cis-trans isomerase FKBP43-like isoform X3 [Apium graveolens]|uniref:peptidyl-prolyl cis-trans isomerase FKBP43-like isoform X3 n=1 Tax=Apium graveolens TaxID=4045 RepID=UPI003D7B9E1D
MAFWGIQVKPGYPFSLKFDDGISRRLRISQATLAIGSSKKTSLVQCNVGNKSPVLLCALLPDKAESLQLNLEFDEHEEVLFSVIGPRAVHLTGFYAGNPCDDNSESYGVDIANSENEESVAQTDEDEYEDSFINDDDDLEVLPPSPVSNDGVDIVKKRSKKKNARKRLKKKSQVVESDDKSLTWEILPECIRSGVVSDDKRIRKRSQVVESDDESNSGKLNDGSCIKSSVFVSDSEDGIPILSVRKSKKAANNIVSESIACGIASNPKADGSIRNDDPKRTMPKKKSKDAANERKNFEADSANIINEGDEVKESEEKTSHIAFGQDLIVIDDIDDDPGMNTTVPKNKVKGTSNEEKLFEADAADHSNPHDKAKTRNLKTRDIVVYRDPIVGNNSETRFLPGSLLPTVVEGSDKPKKKRKREQEEKTPAENDLVVPERKADENTSKKAARKKKQKSKVKDENLDVAVLLNGGKENFKNEVLEENVFSGSSQVRALSNGLVIEELEASKSEGKAAAPRRKLKVQYLAKLKENGEIIGSNGKAPYRFRLGDEDVMEGWNIGLDGMHAGDKRRLTVPPSLGNWSGGSVENIPPDSWVIYDVELLSVR